MSRITFNRNVAKSSGVTADSFSTGDYKFGEIVICNDAKEPGVYILTKHEDGTSGPIAKVNSSKSILIDGAMVPSINTPVESGDTLLQAVIKLQNQINSVSSDTRVQNIITAVGLKDDGTYEAISEAKYISGATSVKNALKLLDEALFKEVSARTIADKELSNTINKETSERMEADSAITKALEEEVLNRIASEETFTNAFKEEVSKRSKGDELLSKAIEEEVEGRIEADNTLTESINKEVEDRTAADNVLSESINKEVNDRIAADNILSESIAKEVNDRKNAISSLTIEINADDGNVFTTLSQDEGHVSGGVKTISLERDSAGLVYTLKLGDYEIGKINIPEDQFLSGVSFISAATIDDVIEARTYGQTIELGKPYLKFVWKLCEEYKPTYVDVGALSKTSAKDIKLSSEYTGTTYDIHSGTTVETSIEKLVNNISIISATSISHSIKSNDKTIKVLTDTSGTSVDVYNDDDTIIKSDLISTQGCLSVKLDVSANTNDDGSKAFLSEYTLKSKNGEYGKIIDKRTFVETLSGTSEGKFISSNRENKIIDGVTTDSWKLGLKVQEDIESATGPETTDGNGLATAYGIRQYIRAGMDGDDIWVGDDTPSYHFSTDKLVDKSTSIMYDRIHGALIKQENNQEELDLVIGLKNNYVGLPDNVTGYRHLYPSGETQSARFFSAATTVMGAIRNLDDNIVMEWGDNSGTNKSIRTRETECSATTDYAFAEGFHSMASGMASHSEGGETTASGNYSHSEGSKTKASAVCSHAEGSGTTASGTCSHAEGGYTKANGEGSHAEGIETKAFGIASHTEGVGTVANNMGEHACGKYNESTSGADGTIFSVGTGPDDSNRKNAFEIRENDRAFGKVILTTSGSVMEETAIGKIVDSTVLKQIIESNNYDDTAITNQYVKEVDETNGLIKVSREGLPVTKIEVDTESYVNLKISASTDSGSQKDSDFHIWAEPDVCDTKDAITACTSSEQKLAGAYGVKEWIESLDKSGKTTDGQFIRYVEETDGLVSEAKSFILHTDIKISGITPTSASVKEEFALFNGNNDKLGETIKIYKDSSFVRAYIGTMGDTINEITGVVTPGVGSESLNIIHIDYVGKYQMAKIDLKSFVIETEFKDGLKVSGHSVYVTIDSTSEKDSDGNNYLQVISGGGVSIRGINDQITKRIEELDSSSSVTSNFHAITSITMTDGKISSIGETDKINSANTSANSEKLSGVSISGLFTDFSNTISGDSGETQIVVGGTTKKLKVNADTVDGYHFVVGSTGTTKNTIYFL